jgi:hypothetical protein
MDNRLFMQKPRNSISLTTFTDVFETTFWIVLSIVLVGLLISFNFVGRFVDQNVEQIRLDDSTATVLLAVVGQTVPIVGKILSIRILLISTCLTGAFVIWGFNAGIVSVLTVENVAFPVKNFQVVKSQIIITNKKCVT